MTARDPGKEVGPGQRAGIGVGDVDLDLGHDHERHGGGQHHAGRFEHIAEGHLIHMRRLGRLIEGQFVLERKERQQRAAKHLQTADDDPAGARRHHGKPPAGSIGRPFLGQEPQVIHLFADLADQCECHAAGGPERAPAEAAVVLTAREAGEVGEGFGPLGSDGEVRQDEQNQPDRLGEPLQAVDRGDAEGHQRNDRQRADQVGHRQRHREIHRDRLPHDRRFESEEQERETGIDQRRERRAEIAEPRAAGEQIDIHAVAGGVIADRQTDQKYGGTDGTDRPGSVGEAIAHHQHGADRLQGQKRDTAERGAGDTQLRPFTKAAGGKAQRIVLERFVAHPAVVGATDLDDALRAVVHEAVGSRASGRLDPMVSTRACRKRASHYVE